MTKEETLVILKAYFKPLAQTWDKDNNNICLIDEYLDLEHLANYIIEESKK